MFQPFAIILSEQKRRILSLLTRLHVFFSKSKLLFSRLQYRKPQNVARNHYKLFQPLFLSLDPFKTARKHEQQTGDGGCYNQLYLRFEAAGLSFHLPKGCELGCTGQHHSICQCRLKTRGGRGRSKTGCFIFSGVGVVAPVIRRSLV